MRTLVATVFAGAHRVVGVVKNRFTLAKGGGSAISCMGRNRYLIRRRADNPILRVKHGKILF